MDEELLTELSTRFPCRQLRYAAGQVVQTRGEPYRSLLVLLEGSVAAEMSDPEGHTLHVETIAAPEAIASAILFAPHNLLPVTVRAQRRVRLIAVPADAVMFCCGRDPEILRTLLRDMGRRAWFLAEKLRLTQFSTLRQKLASYLVERSRQIGNRRFALSATRQDLADLFGAARPSVSRVFAELVREGLVSQEGGQVELLDSDALARVAASGSDGPK
jgi:CRP-like cAMP-binding protein